MALPLVTRRWQRGLRRGTLKRNSTALKPAIWIFQQMRIREMEQHEAAKAFQKLRRVR